MSDPLNAETPSADEVPPEPGDAADGAALQSAADLDEDELGTDPLETDAPDQWTTVTAERPTPREQRAGETLEHRLDQERSEEAGESEVPRPLAETRMHELDETVDERAEAEVDDSGDVGPEQGT